MRKVLTWFSFLAMAGAVVSTSPIGNQTPMGNQTVPGALSMHATIESIGIVAPYTGDDNQNNAASIWYRPVGTSAWSTGHEMFADRAAREWRVSLVNLSPGTSYEVQVRYTDPDGVAPDTAGGPIATLPDYPSVGGGGKVLYVPDNGDLQSVIHAASPGDTILIRGGTYHTSAVLTSRDSGTPGKYVTIEPVPGEHVILDGSDPDVNNPAVDNWSLYQGNIYYTHLSWGGAGCGEFIMPHYVGEQRGGDVVRYLLYQDTAQWNAFLAAPPGKAYYDCSGGLYVATYESDDPDNHVMVLSQRGTGLYLRAAKYIRIRNLEFRHYGLYGVHVDWPGADHNIIEGNTFHDIGRQLVRIGDCNSACLDNLIQDNNFYMHGYRESGWSWDEQYNYASATGLMLLYAGPGNVVRRNTFKGGTDGIDVNLQSHNIDVYENVIEECMDDGIEVDDEPGYNIRVWGNVIRHCYSSISNQSWYLGNARNSGPVYIFRNVIEGGADPQGRKDHNGSFVGYGNGYAFKVAAATDWVGRVYYYHNTISIPYTQYGGIGIQDAGGNHFVGLVSRNNLWNVGGAVFYLRYPTTVSNHDLDCDNLHNPGTPTDDHFIRWSSNGGPEGNGIYRNLPDFQRYTGQELHGISANGTLFNPDLSLRAGSPEIDAGCVIVGFNDRGPWKYKGPKPDIGAFEHASSPDLSASTKTVNSGAVSTGESIAYTVRIENIGIPLTTTAVMTDILPAGLDYLPGTLTATLGVAQVILGTATSIHWQGMMSDTFTVEIRYEASVNITGTVALSNTARIDDGLAHVFNRTAIIIINGWPVYLPLLWKGA